uniref:Uncharacterized protein n=1 Tax=Arundo donax TaxID=35708 RepID=A0A0A9CBQ1_ARUDO
MISISINTKLTHVLFCREIFGDLSFQTNSNLWGHISINRDACYFFPLLVHC